MTGATLLRTIHANSTNTSHGSPPRVPPQPRNADKRCSPSRGLADNWSKIFFQCRARTNPEIEPSFTAIAANTGCGLGVASAAGSAALLAPTGPQPVEQQEPSFGGLSAAGPATGFSMPPPPANGAQSGVPFAFAPAAGLAVAPAAPSAAMLAVPGPLPFAGGLPGVQVQAQAQPFAFVPPR